MYDRVLTREEMVRIIEGKGRAHRVPIAIQQWVQPETFGDRSEEYRNVLNQYPCDIVKINFNIPQVFDAPKDDPSYRWMNIDNPFPPNMPLDAVAALDWENLDDVLADFPDPDYPGLIPKDAPADNGQYRVGLWWYFYFERLWSLRGMENVLYDFYEHPDEIHRLFRALTNFYKVVLRRGKEELHLDAIWSSDDIGAQNAPFFSLKFFREFFKPYYKEIIDYTHELGMHFWLHTCGNVKMMIPDLIEIGLDVLHPIQKYAMNEKEIMDRFGGRICFWAGFDVQQIIPYGTPEDVRKEVRFMIDTYFRPDGRLILAAGNNMTKDTSLASLYALLDEALHYGIKKCSLYHSNLSASAADAKGPGKTSTPQ